MPMIFWILKGHLWFERTDTDVIMWNLNVKHGSLQLAIPTSSHQFEL